MVTIPMLYVAPHFRRTAKPIKSDALEINVSDPEVLLAKADHFYWLNNGAKAAPLYARAERLFANRGDVRGELCAKVGLRRSQAETESFVDLSRFLDEQLRNPIVVRDPQLRLRCLVAKG